MRSAHRKGGEDGVDDESPADGLVLVCHKQVDYHEDDHADMMDLGGCGHALHQQQ